MIPFYFDIDSELSKVIVRLNASKFSDDLAFQKGNFSDVKSHDVLQKKKVNAEKQGDEYLEKWYVQPCNLLLNELKNQIEIKGS